MIDEHPVGQLPEISLIIPTYNRSEILVGTLRLALSQDHPDYEVIVIDQSLAVPESITQAVEQGRGRVRYIHLTEPNLPAARNAGVRSARGKIIAFIDDDVILETDYLSRLARHYINGRVGGVVGLSLPDRPFSISDVLREHSVLLGVHRTIRDGEVLQVPNTVGCNMSFRRQAIIDAGMSDESFSGSGLGEDIDLGARLTRCGYWILLDTNIRLIHMEAKSGGCENRKADLATVVHQQELMVYLNLKLATPSLPEAARRAFWNSYRRIALNRTTVAGGPRGLTSAHCKWAGLIVRAIRKTVRWRRKGTKLRTI